VGRTLADPVAGIDAAAVVTFALGLGANLAIFSVVDRLMFRPLPYAEPHRLVQIHDRALLPPNPFAALPHHVARELMERSSSFDGLAYASVDRETERLKELGDTPVRLALASDNLLDVLRVPLVIGHIQSGQAGGDEWPMLLTYETWRNAFGSRPDAVGTRIGPYRVAGVLPRDFLLPSSALAEIHAVILEPNSLRESRDPRMLTVAPVARLRPDVTVAEAQAEADVLYQQITSPEAVRTRAPRLIVQPLQQGIFFLYRTPLWLVVGTGAIVLLAACVNLGTLLLARSRVAERARAIRVALGAPFSHLLAGTVIETLLICLSGTAIALTVCVWTQQVLLAVVPPSFRGFATSALDLRLVLLSAAVTIVVALVASLAPAWHARQTDVLATLDKQTRTAAAKLRGGGVLLVVQAAFGVVLVAGAVLTVGSYFSLAAGGKGWVRDDLFQLHVQHGGAGAGGDDKGRVLRVVETVESAPGVMAAAAANRRPFDNFGLIRDQWKALGHEGGAWGVTAGLFSAMGMSLRAGRTFSPDEVARKALVIVLNETAVSRLWPGVDPAAAVGRTVRTTDGERLVVGIVGDIQRYPGETPVAGMYLPLTADEMRMSQSAVEVLVRVEPGRRPDVALTKQRLDEQFGVTGLEPARRVSDMLAPWFERPRFLAALMGSFALIALTLAALGVFAMSSFDASRRRNEMAVRVTLGATRRHLGRLILKGVVGPVAAGSVLGVVAAWWAARFLEGLVSGMHVQDVRIHGAVALLLVVVAAAAGWLPARRASRADPAEILKSN
jgi:putative ABC transport system permease protein